MRIRCSQSQLLLGINTVSKAVPSKTSMTILECILLNADENGIKLTANDMELGIETYIEGEVEIAGSVAIEAKIISNLIRSYSGDDFIIDSDSNNTVHIECGKSKIDINGRSTEEFVLLPELDKSNPIEISQFSLKELIRQTIFLISTSSFMLPIVDVMERVAISSLTLNTIGFLSPSLTRRVDLFITSRSSFLLTSIFVS